MLIIICAVAFLPDYGSSVGAVTLIPQSMEWGVTQDGMLRSLVGNIFMEGAAGPFIVAFMAYFGRLPVLFWFVLMAVWTAAICAGSKTLDEFIAARILNGTFSTVAQAGGLLIIKDLFYVHEYARKINIWSFSFILSPYLGPLITAFIVSDYSWPWAFGLHTLMAGLCFIAIILFGEETYYNRNIAPGMKVERKSRIMRLVGVEQFKSRHERGTLLNALMKPVWVALTPAVFITCFYTFLIFSWVIGTWLRKFPSNLTSPYIIQVSTLL
jgi:MFS family permease